MALQEIGPRFTLKLRSLKKGIPAVYNLGEAPAPLTFDNDDDDPVEAAVQQPEGSSSEEAQNNKPTKTVPPKQNEVLWEWKVRLVFSFIHDPVDIGCSPQPELETSRKTFFL